MKTISDHPGLVGRLLRADRERREKLHARQQRRWVFRNLLRQQVLWAIPILVIFLIALVLACAALAIFPQLTSRP